MAYGIDIGNAENRNKITTCKQGKNNFSNK